MSVPAGAFINWMTGNVTTEPIRPAVLACFTSIASCVAAVNLWTFNNLPELEKTFHSTRTRKQTRGKNAASEAFESEKECRGEFGKVLNEIAYVHHNQPLSQRHMNELQYAAEKYKGHLQNWIILAKKRIVNTPLLSTQP